MIRAITVRPAITSDVAAMQAIYNQGIEDGIATLDTEPKSAADMAAWFDEHGEQYPILVAFDDEAARGWASLNRFSHRCAHAQIADLSVYVEREYRGCGIGFVLLDQLVRLAKPAGFHKIVLHALNDNEAGKRLYDKVGFREVGIFGQHGRLNGRLVDVVAMEKIL